MDYYGNTENASVFPKGLFKTVNGALSPYLLSDRVKVLHKEPFRKCGNTSAVLFNMIFKAHGNSVLIFSPLTKLVSKEVKRMELLDLAVTIERYISARGLSHDDSISALINALNEDGLEEL